MVMGIQLIEIQKQKASLDVLKAPQPSHLP